MFWVTFPIPPQKKMSCAFIKTSLRATRLYEITKLSYFEESQNCERTEAFFLVWSTVVLNRQYEYNSAALRAKGEHATLGQKASQSPQHTPAGKFVDHRPCRLSPLYVRLSAPFLIRTRDRSILGTRTTHIILQLLLHNLLPGLVQEVAFS